ncbi:X-linked retinitis pigmentosa GTPase regulator isoform X6 [Caretta caretta]|uniref:X-linked retinitis pigmentosa GTPase regulator isoform X6 n=1 Tax=Caretta caretta TaxID=8467 RepID=UPI002095B163|nr:X-linked retinitis pigmentosa GTPase regulator isoform X7 [Caretta caretta]
MGEAEEPVPESGAVFTFGKSKFAENIPSKFWFKNDKPLYMSCGDEHTAIVTGDGELYTFGEPENGKLGLSPEQLKNSRVPQLVPGILGRVNKVACGGGHTVALTETDVYTFGLGQYGQLGHGTFIFETSAPKAVEHLKRHKICNIACGENHTAVIADNGLMFTFGDGRHGKLGLGEENFTNQFIPTLCSNFLKFTVCLVACGGCHMLVFATPRPKGSEEIHEDLRENCLAATISKLGGDSLVTNTLQRTLSARMRRREREKSPEQFCRMVRTLPPLGEGSLKPSLRAASNTVPLNLPTTNHPDVTEANTNKAIESTVDCETEDRKQEKDKPEESTTEEDSDKESDDRSLGNTTDVLNMTHMMRLNPSDQSLKLTPVQKQKDQKTSEDEEIDEEEEEITDKEEEEEEGGSSDDGKVHEKEERDSKTPEGERSNNTTTEIGCLDEQEEKTTQEEKILQQERENTDTHPENSSLGAISESSTDRISGGILGRTKKFSLFKRKSLTSQKNVHNSNEGKSEKPLQSEKDKGKEADLSGDDRKDENQNHTRKNPKETTTNQGRKTKSSTCIIL